MELVAQLLKRLVATLALFLARLHAFLPQLPTLHKARLARLDELHPLLSSTLDQTSLLLGRTRFNQLLAVKPTKQRRELGHLMIVAPTRSGKSQLGISQLLSWPHSVVCNDVKGELFVATGGFRSTLGRVYVIDPTGVGNSYDPLHGRHTEDEFLSSATQLLYTPEERDTIFTQRAIVQLTQLFLASSKQGYPPLPYVRSMIRQGLPKVAARLNSIDPELATQFLDVGYNGANLSDRFLLSSWGTLTARMRPLLTETVVRSLAAADFTAEEIMCAPKPVTVYLRWPERHLLALAPLVRLIWGSLIDELITTYDQAPRACHPVLLLIDEAGRQALPSLAEHVTTVAGRGISVWASFQSLSQLEVIYGKARSQVLRDNLESQLFYRPSDIETARYLENRLGRRSDYAHSQSIREGEEVSQGLAEQGVPLMTAQELLQIGDDEVFAFHRRLPPIRAKRLDWGHYRLLRQRRAIPAPKLDPLPPLAAAQLPGFQEQVSTFPDGYIDPDLFLVEGTKN